MEWEYYYNLEGVEQVRANLVYTPYVSADRRTFCMSFNRDPGYHCHEEENAQWNDELLTDRFNRELEFYFRAGKVMPTLKIIDLDMQARKIYLEWHGDDFYMQGYMNGGFARVLPDWQEQWLTRIKQMWDAGIVKMSLHPNSWVAKDGVLLPFNWFFSYRDDERVAIRDVMRQISRGRQEKLGKVLADAAMDLDTPYNVNQLQRITFDSFRSNYPGDLIDRVLQLQLGEQDVYSILTD